MVRRGVLTILASVTILSGCVTTRNTPFVEVDRAVQEGNYQVAADRLSGDNRDLFYRDRDKVLYYLDAGMLNHYAGNFGESAELLSEAERLIEEYFTKSVSQAAGSLLLNDTVQDYAGEDYEDIYLNVFNALNYLQRGSIDGAFVEVRRINNKLNLLEDKYRGLASQYNSSDDARLTIRPGERKFYNSALARYLSLLMYRSEGDYDSARIDYQEIREAFEQQPSLYDFPIPISDDSHQPSRQPRINVLAFAGQSPVKRANTLYIETDTDVVYVQIERENSAGYLTTEAYDRIDWPGMKAGYRFKFQLPRMDLRGSDVSEIVVSVDGAQLGRVQLLEDIERIAQATFRIRLPIVYLKTITRTVAKGVLAQRGKEQMEANLGAAGALLGALATDLAVDASEQADLRLSRYFPAFAYTGEWEVEPGTYDVRVEYRNSQGTMFVDDFRQVEVTVGGLNLVTSYFLR